MKRRDFLKLIGAGAVGTLLPLPKRNLPQTRSPCNLLELMGMPMTDPAVMELGGITFIFLLKRTRGEKRDVTS